MPPRYAYWTIILEGKPTAFRSHHRDELLPTFKQLQVRHPDVVMKWFSRGRLWSSPEEEHAALAAGRRAPSEHRARDWRPGGSHQDPRARFKVPRGEKRLRFAKRLGRQQREPQGGAGQRGAGDPSGGAWRSRQEKRGVSPGGRRPGGRGPDAGGPPGQGGRGGWPARDRGSRDAVPKEREQGGRGPVRPDTRGWRRDRRTGSQKGPRGRGPGGGRRGGGGRDR